MRDFKNKRIQIGFTVAGAVGGFLYWKLIGCENGTCAIKSVWYWSTLWAAVVGYLVGDLICEFIGKRKRRRKNG